MDNTKKEKPKADTYHGLHGSVQSFNGIKCLEAVNGNIVLRGRNGERDHIFKLEDAFEKYKHTLEVVQQYARYGVRGWDTLAEIADDFKARIFEAAEQRNKMEIEVPQIVQDFINKKVSIIDKPPSRDVRA